MGTQGSTKSPAIGPNNLGGPAMGGKMHGGGVKLQPKKENTGGGMDLSQRKMMAGDYSPTKSGVISGSHSKGGFMKHAKSSKGYAKANYDKDMAEERIQIKDDKNKIIKKLLSKGYDYELIKKLMKG